MAKKLTSTKAKKILHDKEVHGHALTDKQRRFFGAIAGGAKPYAQYGSKVDKFGLTREDYINARKNKFILTPDSDKGDGYYEYKKDNKSYKVYTESGGNSWVDVPKKAAPKKVVTKLEPKKEMVVPQPLLQNIYKGTPLYSPGAGSGFPSSLVGFVDKGDTTYIKPEDYERFAVPQYGKKFIEGKRKKAQNGIEGTMGGLTDVGFDYNGAWGGPSMQLGGSLPGAMGMMYARVGAPSNGPYAKKTLASAQNGMEMKYYQDGLDFKPKTISRYGSEIPQAQLGSFLSPITSEDVSRFFSLFSIPQKAATKLVTGKYQTPSEAMKIKNPVGAFATDAILDPVNLIGIGAAGKIGKATKVANKKLAPELSNYVIERNPYKFDISKVGHLPESQQKQVAKAAERSMNALIDYAEREAYRKHGSYRKDPLTGQINPVLKEDMYMDMMKNHPDVDLIRRNKEGGVIKDNMGQWAHPGEITQIDSPYITMKGVPYPVLGISNSGDTRMMYPGEDYTFEGDYVTEYPMAKNGVSVNKADEAPLKKLDQLLNFTNYNDMAKAKQGKKLPSAQYGPGVRRNTIGGIPDPYRLQTYNPSDATYNSSTGMFNSPSGQITMQDTRSLGFKDNGNPTFNRFFKDLDNKDLSAGVQATSTIGRNVQKIRQAVKQKKEAKQLSALAPVILQATGTREELNRNMYVRPEDMAFGTNQLSPSYGTGAGFLQAQSGAEIQNTYAPNTLYDNLGYEPLDDSSKVKQYKKGGIAKASLGETIGLIEKGIDIGGDIASGLISIGTNRLNKQSYKTLGQAAFQSGMQGVQNQYSGFMEDGGWISHDWQPQVITKFGDYDVKDLLAPPKDADMLRSGGHLKEDYVQPSARALQTMAKGGKFTPLWGGDIEPVSYNPYMDGDGFTYEAKGNYHSQSDGRGNTGVGMDYEGSQVEVQPKEPIFETGGEVGPSEKAATVLGGMKMENYALSEINEEVGKKLQAKKGQTFQAYGRELNKQEKKALKNIDKNMDIVDSVDDDSPFSLLKLNSGKMGLMGSNMSLKQIAEQKKKASYVQSGIHDAKDEMSEYLGKPLEVNAFAKGIIKEDKEAKNKAQFGIYLYRQQGQQASPVVTTPPAKTSNKTSASRKLSTKNVVASATPPAGPSVAEQMAGFSPWGTPTSLNLQSEPQTFGTVGEAAPFQVFPVSENKTTGGTKEEDKGNKPDFIDLYNALYPSLRPAIRNPLSFLEIAPEMTALALNQLEPVPAQKFTPQLQTPYRVSLQDQLNEIQADANATKRLVGNNPAVLATIDAQVARLKSNVLAQEQRTNVGLAMETYNRNIETLNKSTLTNLQLAADQATKQSMARSATKAQSIEAFKSIAQKIGQNKYETLSANVMANMYPQYTFGPKGRIFNTGLTKFNIPTMSDYSTEELQKILEAKKIEEGKSSKTMARNGSVVKALKNL